jgi:Predicted membrane protein (DUF2306)
MNGISSAKPQHRMLWGATLLLTAIALIAVARRTYVILYPPSANPRFAAAAGMDGVFAHHPSLTLAHILPAGLFMILMPLQFVRRIRTRYPAWHRWSGRFLVLLGVGVGVSALAMSYTTTIGGADETAATTVFALLFLVFLGLGFRDARLRQIASYREWMIRAFGVALGVATTRPIVGVFFAVSRSSPHEFFGTAFWLGFTLTLAGAEFWIRYSRRLRTATRRNKSAVAAG